MASFIHVTSEDLISTGAHFGHLTRRWHPNYKPYIYMEKNGIHIIDIQQTMECLRKAIEAITNIVKKGGTVLFIGTKKQAKDVLQKEADRCGMYYVVERWLGGTLTNFATIKRSIKRLQQLEKDADTLYQTLTKKEILSLERERIRLADQHRGIKDMKQLPDVVYVVDTQYESTAIREARRLEIPIVAIVDSNTDPTLVDYPIPANDDSLRTIQLISSAIADAIIEARGGQSFEEDEGEVSETELVEKKLEAEADAEVEVEAAPESVEEAPGDLDAEKESKQEIDAASGDEVKAEMEEAETASEAAPESPDEEEVG
ncbi:MAG: 30S ribosomal protein S2 [Fidelibacterota bacterium]|nr:MAG: 30S ribosomal protein S2 [Candidatus Neomarinimicrobiota bacterium]